MSHFYVSFCGYVKFIVNSLTSNSFPSKIGNIRKGIGWESWGWGGGRCVRVY